MQINNWTSVLVTTGLVSLASAASADEPTNMSAVQTALSGTSLSGYVDASATWRPGTDQIPDGGPNIPSYRFAKNDGFSLNAIDIALDRPEDDTPWAAGYHIELMSGPDAVGYTSAGGLGSSLALRQAYLALRTPLGNGIDWKIGIWDTIIGYESSSDPLDPNYTRSYGYTIEPTTHTGILATYPVNDVVTIQAGIADSSNVGFGGGIDFGTIGVNPAVPESRKAYMGAIRFVAPESAGWLNGTTLSLGVINVPGHSIASPTATGTTSWYAGLTLPTPIAAWKLGAAFDYLDIHDSHAADPVNSIPANPSDDSAWDIALYSSYQATDKLALNLRAEYLRDQLGGGADFLAPVPYSLIGRGGNAAEAVTATVQYQLWANVISRLEFRWDHVEHGSAFGFHSADVVSSGAYKANDFLLALNLIYQF